MLSGRATVLFDGQEVHNSVTRGMNTMVDVTWNMRGNHTVRVVAHATSAGRKMTRSGGRQYELFVNGQSYVDFLTVDQLKESNQGLVKRPVQRHSMFDRNGPNYNGQPSDDRRHSSGEVAGRQRYSDSTTPIDRSDRSMAMTKRTLSGRKIISTTNYDENESILRLSNQSDESDTSLGRSDRSLGRKMTKSKSNLDGSARSARKGTKVSPALISGEVDRSERSRGKKMYDNGMSFDRSDRSLLERSDRSLLDRSERSLLDRSERSLLLNGSEVDRSERSRGRKASDGTSRYLDKSDRSTSRVRRTNQPQSIMDISDRSSGSHYRRNTTKLRSISNLDESERSLLSNDSHPRPLPVKMYKPVTKFREFNRSTRSMSSEATEKVTNVRDITSKSKVLQEYKIVDKQKEPCCEDDENNSVDTMNTTTTLKRALRTSFVNEARSLSPPRGEVTVVFTDVQGSTNLWETYPTAMKKALDIHDTILRQCYSDHKGYEISTEGDAFNIAFQHPVDAFAFALQAQIKLYKAEWPKEILNHPDGVEEPFLKFKGLRVRFSINHGPTANQIHRVTGRTVYTGEGVKIAKALGDLCYGGQILCTMETWKAVGGLAERYLGRPQILDCGEHLLFEANRTRYSRRIMQLVPNELAFDFFEARGQAEDGTVKDSASMKVGGRLFPPLISKKQLTTSFLNAPHANGRVVICFVYTVGLDSEDISENRNHNLAKLSQNLRKQLLRSNPPGCECQEDSGCWMLAFEKTSQAVMFGLKLMASIRKGAREHLLGDVDCDRMYKIGIVSGPFTSMGPHKTTGQADYFGPVVNRAARVASSCEPGQLCVGVPLTNGARITSPSFGNKIQVRLLGIKQLKGVSVDVAVYRCSECVQNDE